jgi:putative ABC transport system substrate-binding protein
MRRRDVIGAIVGAAVAPVVGLRRAGAQQTNVPVVGVLGGAGNDADGQARLRLFNQALQSLGRIDGRNVQLDVRLVGNDPVRIRANAAELVRANPAMILAIGTPVLVALRELTRSIPIVFANVSDPVDGGFVDSEARPGGNITGFTSFEYSVASKWVEILKEVSPRLTRVLVLLNPDNYTSRGLLRSVQAAAPLAGVQVVAGRVIVAGEIAPVIADFARQPGGGIIIAPDSLIAVNMRQIVALSDQHRLPGIYAFRDYPANGGLLSYGTEMASIYGGAATYTDRILKGEKPAELPVQNPTRYQLVINLKAAKTLGIEPSAVMLGRADEVIE